MAPRVDVKPLPPTEAIEYFEKKGYQESFAWQDVWQEEHAKAFTIAGGLERELLQDVRELLDQALKEGMTLEQFKEKLRTKLEARGWGGPREVTDPKTGKTKIVDLTKPRRLKTIFDTNMRTAYSVGRWQRFQKTKAAFPYLRYNHTPQEHPRPEHLAWDGTILPVDDPWWDTHFTPNGWNCKCYVTQLSARLMKARGWEVTDKPIRFPPRPYTNPRTGEISVLEGGIDPGWSYNPGKAYLDGITPKPTPGGPDGEPSGAAPGAPDRPAPEAEQARAPEAPGAGAPPPGHDRRADRELEFGELEPIEPHPGPQPLPEDVEADEAQASFLHGFDLAPDETKVITDAGGEPFIAGPGLFTSSAGAPATFSQAQLRILPLVSAAIRTPAEIRWTWLLGPTGKPKLVRRYIARFIVGDRPADVVVDAAPAGGSPSWSFASSLTAADGWNLDALRVGLLAWKRGRD